LHGCSQTWRGSYHQAKKFLAHFPLFTGVYFLIRHDKRAAAILFFAVFSHWILDVISHKHSLAPGVPVYIGLGLWKHFLLTIIIEDGFWLAAIIIYVHATHAVKPMGIYGFWPVVAFLTFVWMTNVQTEPPPARKSNPKSGFLFAAGGLGRTGSIRSGSHRFTQMNTENGIKNS
jgi:hypothetical protein